MNSNWVKNNKQNYWRIKEIHPDYRDMFKSLPMPFTIIRKFKGNNITIIPFYNELPHYRNSDVDDFAFLLKLLNTARKYKITILSKEMFIYGKHGSKIRYFKIRMSKKLPRMLLQKTLSQKLHEKMAQENERQKTNISSDAGKDSGI